MPGNVASFSVREEGEQACGRNQSNQAGTLGAMLVEGEEQSKQRNQKNATADAEEPRGDSANRRREKNTDVASRNVTHRSFAPCEELQERPGPEFFSTEELPPASENSRTTL